MSTTAEIRLRNLNTLIEEFGTQDAVAELANTSQVYLSQLKNMAMDSKTGRPREIGPRLARKLEQGCNKPKGWMDVSHDDTQPPAAPPHVAEATSVYKLPTQTLDPLTIEMIGIFGKLDKESKLECLSYLRGYSAGRHSHPDGQDLQVARS